MACFKVVYKLSVHGFIPHQQHQLTFSCLTLIISFANVALTSET